MKWFDVQSGSDFNCPKCGKGLDAHNWDTEYGDPMHGDFDVECPNCHTNFKVQAEPTVIWSVLLS